MADAALQGHIQRQQKSLNIQEVLQGSWSANAMEGFDAPAR